MKKIATTALLTLITVAAFGLDLKMITSKDALRTYALEQSAIATASVSTYVPSGMYSYSQVNVESPTAVGISNTIAHMPLSLDVVNPKDQLFSWAGVYNSEYDSLFESWKWFTLVQDGDRYRLPADYGKCELEMSQNIPIKIPGAQSAMIDLLNDDGSTRSTYSLIVRDGKLYFPRQLAGTNAIVSLYINGKGTGEWVSWNVRSGLPIKPAHFDLEFKTTIKGVVSIADNNVIVTIPTKNGVGTNLTAELTSSGKSILVVSYWTTEGKWFKGAKVRKAGTTEWKHYDAIADKKEGMMAFDLPVQTGVYYIIPEWNDGDLVEPADPWYPPYYGGEKVGTPVG